MPVESELNNPDGPVDGFFNIDSMISPAGFRWAVNYGYLPRSVAQARRERLTICTGAVATKIDVGHDGIARGVRFLDPRDKRPREYYARARREVIVCCGTAFTPQLLMLR